MTIDDGGSTGLGQVHSLELRTEDATGPGLPQVRIRAGGGPRSRAWPPHRAAPVDRGLHMVAPAAVPLRRSSQDCAARSAGPPHASGAWCPDGVILFVLLWIVTIQVLWLRVGGRRTGRMGRLAGPSPRRMPAPSSSATGLPSSRRTRSSAGRSSGRVASPASSTFTRRCRSGWPGSERRCQGSVIPGRVSDQITHTAMAITRIDQNG